jgi:hypothetical protein
VQYPGFFVRQVFATILTAATLFSAGGCDSWFKKDSFEARAAKDPNLSPELKRLLEMKKQQGRHPSRDLQPGDPKYMESLRKKSKKDQQKTLDEFSKAQKEHKKRMEKEKANPNQEASARTGADSSSVPPPKP